MEDVLARLWELCEGDAADTDTVQRRPQNVVTEAQHLWKTLETLVATTKAQDLRVHDPVFSTLLACVHAVIKTPSAWAPERPSSPLGRSIFEFANRVLIKIGCRGEDEREAVLREGYVVLLVETLQGSIELSAGETAAVLHVFQTLAFDTKHRIELLKCDAVVAGLRAMATYPQDLNVQLFGCKFLQFMAYEEATKELVVQHNGISIILDALASFAADVQLATSASDVLYFLSLDLESTLAQQETKFLTTVEAIMESVVRLMRRHPSVEAIQAHGVAILLTFGASHTSARYFLATAIPSMLWEVLAGALDVNEDATMDAIDVLDTMLEDSECYDHLQGLLHSGNTVYDASEQMRTLHSLTALQSRLAIKRNRPQYASKSRELAFIVDRLQAMIDSSQSPPPASPGASSVVDEEIRLPVPATRDAFSASVGAWRRGDDGDCDDSQRFLDQQSPVKGNNARAKSDSYGFFDQYMDADTAARQKREHHEAEPPKPRLARPEAPACRPQQSDTKSYGMEREDPVQNSRDWQRECEKAQIDLQDVENEYKVLQDNYQIVVRRAREQSKLLNIQNARIRHHMEVHQHALERVRTLEGALSDAMRKHQVERELRLAEVAQSEKISQSLHEAMKEIKTLNKQNSSTSRELEHKEKLRVDYQQKASVIRHQQQKLEYERDDAVVQMIAMRTEQRELNMQLEETRREASEALLMREEDIDAPKPSAFCEMLSLSPTARARKVSNYTFTTKRVVVEANERHVRHQEQRKSMYAGSLSRVVRPVDASMMRKASICSGQVIADRCDRSGDIMIMDGGFEDEEEMMEPPKEEAFSTYHMPPRGMDKFEIERTLRAIYESFDKSPDSNGVHLATVRRFFGDCGIVQPPLVSGDVDTILTRVLNQAQENRKRIMVRKDFTIAIFPGDIGRSSGQKKATEAKRFRFFDEEAFFEAVTLLVMRRFPRFDAKKALEVFITEYVHPMQRQQQQAQLLLQRRSSSGSMSASMMNASTTERPVRSGSMTGGGNSSPTAACIGILKAVLNGLALHVGRDDEPKRQEDPRFLTKQDSSMLLTMGHHNRKPKREDVVYSMLEMHAVLAREYKPLATICEFYSAMHHTPRDVLMKDETMMPLSFELLLTFAMDFEIIPSFMDRLSLKHMHSEVSGYLKTYLTLQKKTPPPHAMDVEMLKKVAFSMVLARLGMELFSTKREYETPEKQITALLQWLDNSVGREKIQKKAMIPIVIKFSRKLYALRS